MNLLAHSYLSFNHNEILVGNMISDFVKGRKKFDYDFLIQKGIQLHRDIDTFTDNHTATKEAKTFLKPAAGLYAGAFVDVLYDHFLAIDPGEFSNTSLLEHSLTTYDILQHHYNVLPQKLQAMLPYMIKQNWLYKYKDLDGMKNSFAGVARRAVYLNNSDDIYALFIQHYPSLQKCYNGFFHEVKSFSLHRFKQLLNE